LMAFELQANECAYPSCRYTIHAQSRLQLNRVLATTNEKMAKRGGVAKSPHNEEKRSILLRNRAMRAPTSPKVANNPKWQPFARKRVL
jgi:hypothetical protein